MKTLIITGTPRKKGHTIAMAEYLAGQLDGEVEWLSVDNRKDITPCRDCRYCFTHPKCAIDDPMNEIYAKLDAADRIIFAAPVYFYNIPGSMKAVLDRLQVYWAAIIREGEKSLTGKGRFCWLAEHRNPNGSFWEHPLRSSTCWMIWEQSVKVS